MAEKISETSVISRAPKLAQRLFEERMLVITPSDSMLHRFNEVGTAIWQLIEKPCTVSAVIDTVAAMFDGFDKKKNGPEVISFLNDLLGRGIVSVEQPR